MEILLCSQVRINNARCKLEDNASEIAAKDFLVMRISTNQTVLKVCLEHLVKGNLGAVNFQGGWGNGGWGQGSRESEVLSYWGHRHQILAQTARISAFPCNASYICLRLHCIRLASLSSAMARTLTLK